MKLFVNQTKLDLVEVFQSILQSLESQLSCKSENNMSQFIYYESLLPNG